ncbi:MAG: methyltransferase domain-containing protein, partial [Candidatus Eremiobacteraeota bacterium]|nr:methyltransferase domain-containing protein [Candidatus Eremiobacteraeota bacterium]
METESLKSYAPITAADESALDVNTSYAQILHFIEGSPKVVDFGCGPGNLARFLTQRGCTVVGVEINPESASLAREYCADVLIADLDDVLPLTLFPNERFDVAIFADILEHLRKPERLLAEVSRILRPGGYVIASIPNVAHGAIRLAMLKGDFDYQEIGILDDTHLRFFTRKTTEKLFEDAGFFVGDIRRTAAPIFEPSSELVPAVSRADFTDEVARKIEEDPEAQTVQFVVKAVPAGSPEARHDAGKKQVAALTARVQELEEQLGAAQAELAQKLDAPTLEHFARVQDDLHNALLGPDGAETLRAQLQQKSEELEEARRQMTALVAREESTNRREKKLADENGRATALIRKLEADIESRKTTLATQNERMQALQEELTQRSSAFEDLRAQLQHANEENGKAAKMVERLTQDAERFRDESRTAKRELAKAAHTVEQQKGAIAELESGVVAAQTQAQAAQDDLDEAARRIESQAEAIALLEAELAATREELAIELATAREEHTAELATARDELARTRMQAQSLATLHKSSEAERLHLSAQIDDLRDEYEAAVRSRSQSTSAIEKLSRELAELRELLEVAERKVADKQAELDTTRNELREAEERRVKTDGEYDRLQREFHVLASERVAVQARIGEIEEHYAHATAEIQTLREEL